MVSNLSHKEWIKNEFKDRALNIQYRNAVIHASIIEGVLVSVSGTKRFVDANKALLVSTKINPDEYDDFEQLRDVRNNLIHGIFKNGLSQLEIDGLRDNIMKSVHKVYKSSPFLQKHLFEKYDIEKTSKYIS